MAESKTKSAPQAEAAAAEGGLLDQIISKSRIARTDSERDRTRDLIGELVGQVMDGQLVVSRDAIASLDARVADIDKLISDQLSAVMHTPEFQKLEGSWRGLKSLVENSETSTNLKNKVFKCRKKELVKEFRSEERRDGKGGDSTGRYRGSP